MSDSPSILPEPEPKPGSADPSEPDGDAAAGLRFECTQCGKCCFIRGEYGHVYLNDAEMIALARHLELSVREFRARYTTRDELGWDELLFDRDAADDQHCVFLDPDTKRCTVHEARPLQCRTFPFWRDFIREDRWTEEVAAMCEGIGRGEAWDLAQAERIMASQEKADAEE